jgi:hypothetical protein
LLIRHFIRRPGVDNHAYITKRSVFDERQLGIEAVWRKFLALPQHALWNCGLKNVRKATRVTFDELK